MRLTILPPSVGAQKHSRLILSRECEPFKRVGLHYIGFSKSGVAGTRLVPHGSRKIAEIDRIVTNFG
jgi:hypothetical protein